MPVYGGVSEADPAQQETDRVLDQLFACHAVFDDRDVGQADQMQRVRHVMDEPDLGTTGLNTVLDIARVLRSPERSFKNADPRFHMPIEESLCELSVAQQTGRDKPFGIVVRLRIPDAGEDRLHEQGHTCNQCCRRRCCLSKKTTANGVGFYALRFKFRVKHLLTGKVPVKKGFGNSRRSRDLLCRGPSRPSRAKTGAAADRIAYLRSVAESLDGREGVDSPYGEIVSEYSLTCKRLMTPRRI